MARLGVNAEPCYRPENHNVRFSVDTAKNMVVAVSGRMMICGFDAVSRICTKNIQPYGRSNSPDDSRAQGFYSTGADASRRPTIECSGYVQSNLKEDDK